jgi:hypothetical protein
LLTGRSIVSAIAHRVNPRARENMPGDMLQWIIQNIGTVPLLYTMARSRNVEVDSHGVVNRVVHNLRNLGIAFQVRENGHLTVTVTVDARELQELRERITERKRTGKRASGKRKAQPATAARSNAESSTTTEGSAGRLCAATTARHGSAGTSQELGMGVSSTRCTGGRVLSRPI